MEKAQNSPTWVKRNTVIDVRPSEDVYNIASNVVSLIGYQRHLFNELYDWQGNPFFWEDVANRAFNNVVRVDFSHDRTS